MGLIAQIHIVIRRGVQIGVVFYISASLLCDRMWVEFQSISNWLEGFSPSNPFFSLSKIDSRSKTSGLGAPGSYMTGRSCGTAESAVRKPFPVLPYKSISHRTGQIAQAALKTASAVISLYYYAEDSTKLFLSVNSTCSALVIFLHSSNHIISRCFCCCRRRCYSSQMCNQPGESFSNTPRKQYGSYIYLQQNCKHHWHSPVLTVKDNSLFSS